MTSENLQPYLDAIPATLLSTLAALKLQPKLETVLRTYVDSSSNDDGSRAFTELEQKAKPILLDVGAGKRGTVEILEKWKARPAPAAEGESTTAEKTKSSAGPSEAAASKATPKAAASKTAKAASKSSSTAKADAAETTEPPLSHVALAHEKSKPLLQATSQESRFHLDAIETASQEIDLKGVNVLIDEKELLVDAHVRLKTGVHYGLHGWNGVGKSCGWLHEHFAALADSDSSFFLSLSARDGRSNLTRTTNQLQDHPRFTGRERFVHSGGRRKHRVWKWSATEQQQRSSGRVDNSGGAFQRQGADEGAARRRAARSSDGSDR